MYARYKDFVNNHFQFSYWAFLAAYSIIMCVIFWWHIVPSPATRRSCQALETIGLLFVATCVVSLLRLAKCWRSLDKPDTGFWKPDVGLQKLWPWLSIVVLLVFPFLTVVNFNELAAVEAGQARLVHVFALSAMVYGACGFVPAVLCVPLLGLLCLLGLLIRLRRRMTVQQCLEEEQEAEDARVTLRVIKLSLIVTGALVGLFLIWIGR